MIQLMNSGRREWDRTTDPHHVNAPEDEDTCWFQRDLPMFDDTTDQ
jgi:hypothetical protein